MIIWVKFVVAWIKWELDSRDIFWKQLSIITGFSDNSMWKRKVSREISMHNHVFVFCCHFNNLVAKSCQALCNSKDHSLPGSSVRGILQAIILEWVAISFSKGSLWPRDHPTSPALQVYSLPLSQLGVFCSTQLCRHLFSTVGYLTYIRHCASEMQFLVPKSLYSWKGSRKINQQICVLFVYTTLGLITKVCSISESGERSTLSQR